MGYYQWSHNNGVALGWNNKTDTTKKCSPKFIYNMINNGVDSGAYFSDAMAMVQKHGCIPNSNFPEDSSYRAWNLNPSYWQAALSYRSNALQYVYNVDTTTIKSNPNTSSNPLAGKQVMRYVNGTNGSHAMTVVGYDDNSWVDINNNGVVNAGELGVLKIANSWGTGWGINGYMYVAYDALKTTSGISGGPSSGRQPGFQSRLVYHQPVKAANGVAYQPKYLAKFSVKHGSRKQMSLGLGWSTTSSTSATNTITPFALMNKGGAYAFNGTTTANDSTFVMDLTDLPFASTSTNKVYLTLKDNTSGTVGYLNSFELIDLAKSTTTPVATAGISTSKSVDATSTTATLTYNPGGTTTVPTPTPEPTPTPTPTPTNDTTMPTVSITSPLNGSRAYAGKTVTTTATASDNVGVTKVVFRVNNVIKCTDTTAPYSCAFTMPYGTAKIHAWAYDAAGNVRYSTYVYVYRY